MPRLKEADEHAMRRAVIQWTVLLASERWKDSFTIKEVADKAGVSERFIRMRFGGRDELRLLAIREIHRSLQELLDMNRVDTAFGGEGTGHEADRPQERGERSGSRADWERQMRRMICIAKNSGIAYELYLRSMVLRRNDYADELQLAMGRLLECAAKPDGFREYRYDPKRISYVMYGSYVGISALLAKDITSEHIGRNEVLKAFHLIAGMFYAHSVGTLTLQEIPRQGVREKRVIQRLLATEREDRNGYVADDVHDKICEAVIRLSRTKSYREITSADIAMQSGIAVSTLYMRDGLNHEAIIRIVAAKLWDRLRRKRSEIYRKKRMDLWRKLALQIEQAIRIMREFGSAELVLGVTHDSGELLRASHYARRGTAQLLREFVPSSTWKAYGTNASAVAAALWGCSIGLIMVPMADPKFKSKELKEYAELVVTMIRAFGQGVINGTNYHISGSD